VQDWYDSARNWNRIRIYILRRVVPAQELNKEIRRNKGVRHLYWDVRIFVVTNESQYAIETFSLTKIFPDWWGRAKVIAVDNLNLQIKRNEIYGLLGLNGSGKTNTLKMLLNLLYPKKGRALVLGGSSGDTKISARIGYLPEDSYLYRYLSARETLDFFGRIFSLPSAVRKARIDALLEMVGLTGMANRPIGTYSKGMARRIGLAQALINDPDVLILDEPTSGMDPIGTRQMKNLFIQLAKRGKTVLLCSHLLADIEDVCDRIGILYGGRMQVEGQVGDLLRHTDQKHIQTGPISVSALEKIKQIVAQEQLDCQITSPMDKLEEFFIRTVSRAQKTKQPTSGAVNTFNKGGFAEQEDITSSVLDKLISAGSHEQAKEEKLIDTETVQVTKPEHRRDDSLLKKLTKEDVIDFDTEQVRKPEPLEVENPDEKVKTDLLHKLTGDSDDNQNNGQDCSRQTGEQRDV